MAKTANINIRVDPEVKATVDGIFSHFGITVADAVLLELKTTSQFRKDLKRMVKRSLDIGLLDEIVQTLRERKPLDHNATDHRQSHI